MGGDNQLQVRGFLASWGWLVAVLLVLGVALGGYATYTAVVSPGTTEEVVEDEVWSVQTDFSHTAEVQVANPIFENGTVLQNRSTYLTALSPEFNGSYRVSYEGAHEGPVEVTIDRTMVIRAEEEGQVFWRNKTQAGPTIEETVQPGDSITTTVSVNATQFDQRREAIVDQIGSTPGETTLAIEFAVSATGVRNDDPASLTLVDRVPVSVSGDSYSIGQAVGSEEAITQQRVIESQIEYGPLMQIGGPILLLVSLVLLGIGALGYHNGLFELTEGERAALEYFDQRNEFDEWIVETAVPDRMKDREAAEAETLADLVDFAIDSDTAALEDSDSDVVYAVTADLVLTYHPPPAAFHDRDSVKDLLKSPFQGY